MGTGHLYFRLLLVIALSTSAATTGSAESIDFSGKTIELIIPFKEGGGSDTWARFNAPFLSKHLPGRPLVIVRNIPGGGSIKGANRYAARARPTGLSLLGTSASTQFPYLLGDPRVRYDYDAWRVVLASPTGGVVYIPPSLEVFDASEIGKLKGVTLVYGSQGTTSLDLVPLLAFKLLGLNVKAVFGMRGRGAGRLAFERGETNIDYQSSSAYLRNVKPLVDRGEAVPLFAWGTLDTTGDWVRDPAFPDLPHFGEVLEIAHGKEPAGIEWETWVALASAGFAAMKLIVVPKETPEEIIAVYQQAVKRMKRDPEYLAGKARAIGAYEQVTGEEAEKLYRLATRVSPRTRAWVRNWLREEYDLNLKDD